MKVLVPLLCTFALLLPLPARASDESGSLILLAPGANPQQEEIERAIRSQLSDLDAELAVVQLDSFPKKLLEQMAVAVETTQRYQATAVCWWTAGPPAQLNIYVAMSPAARLLSRQVCADEDAGCAEEVAIIVRSTWRAVSQGVQVGVDVAELAVEPVPVPVPKPRWVRPLSFRFGGTLATHGIQVPLVGGLEWGIDIRVYRRLHLSVGGGAYFPYAGSTDRVTVTVNRGAVRGGVRVGLAPQERVELGASIVVGPELLHTDFRADVEATPDESYTMIGARLLAQFSFPIVPDRFALGITLLADVPFNPRTITEGDLLEDPQVVVGSFVVKPALVLSGVFRVP